MIDRKVLFDGMRADIFGGKLTQTQVESVNAIIDAFEQANATENLDWPAYALATARREVGLPYKPVREIGRGAGHKYGKLGRYGQAAYGRGFVQLTWDDNYEWADKALGLNGALLKNFDLALDIKIAARIMALGMIDGAFTGAPLSRYFHAGHSDPRNARKIINGLDHADEIVGYFKKIRKSLVSV